MVQPCSQLYDNDDYESHFWNGVMGIENLDVECAEVKRQMGLYPQAPLIEIVGIRWSKLEVRVVVQDYHGLVRR